MFFRVTRFCTQARLLLADALVGKALALPLVQSKHEQVARFTNINASCSIQQHRRILCKN